MLLQTSASWVAVDDDEKDGATSRRWLWLRLPEKPYRHLYPYPVHRPHAGRAPSHYHKIASKHNCRAPYTVAHPRNASPISKTPISTHLGFHGTARVAGSKDSLPLGALVGRQAGHCRCVCAVELLDNPMSGRINESQG